MSGFLKMKGLLAKLYIVRARARGAVDRWREAGSDNRLRQQLSSNKLICNRQSLRRQIRSTHELDKSSKVTRLWENRGSRDYWACGRQPRAGFRRDFVGRPKGMARTPIACVSARSKQFIQNGEPIELHRLWRSRLTMRSCTWPDIWARKAGPPRQRPLGWGRRCQTVFRFRPSCPPTGANCRIRLRVTPGTSPTEGRKFAR